MIRYVLKRVGIALLTVFTLATVTFFLSKLLPGDPFMNEKIPVAVQEKQRAYYGLDRPVAEYVFQHTQTREFLEKLEDMIAFLLPYYKEEGKVALTVAIGCTGGRHRSVAIAAALHQHLVANGVNSVNVNRDIHK